MIAATVASRSLAPPRRPRARLDHEEGPLRHRRSSSTFAPASLALMALALGTLLVAWSGCSSGGTTTNPTGGTGGDGRGGSSTTTGSTVTTGGSGGGTGGSMSCAGDEKACGSGCVKVSDPAFGCTTTGCDPCAALPNGDSVCASGVCQLGGCEAGFNNCDGDDTNGCEVNVATDPMQCGACGSPCSVPHATPNCVNGKCGIGACDAGRVDCDGDALNGCEAPLDVDPNNCGSCGFVCPAGETCEMGVCGVYCPKDKANCDNDPLNGCETPLQTLTDCEFCGDACDPANASASCDQNGVCHLDQCDPGWANCDSSSDNGCETNSDGDANNCGTCGNVCPSGAKSTAVCQSGVCKINCDPGYSNCDNDPNNGCEIHSDVDVDNCGSGASACGNVCNMPNATAACAGGVCIIAQCNAGFMDCDGNPANGCEVNVQNNTNNCGMCGNTCQTANGTAVCNAGMCGVGTCNAGYADCNGQAADGCEINTANDPNHCGSCPNVCNLAHAASTCTGGVCTIGACNAGYANCNNVSSDGCEINTTNNPLNCGACNTQCNVFNGTAGCSSSMCTIASCNAGWGNCNGLSQDGCETNLTNSVGNCGSCGNNCAANCTGNVAATTCSSSTCGISACSGANYNVDGTCTNGCECPSKGTSSTCGSPSALGTVGIGQTITYIGNLVPNGQEAYLTVTFTGNTNINYRPRIRITLGATEFAFDILSNCQGNALACGVEGGNSTARDNWEVDYASGVTANANLIAIPPVGNNGTVIIHMYRRSGKPLTCNNYTLTISN